MLFNIARALRHLNYQVTIVGPSHPADVVEAAGDEGFDVVILPAKTRRQYLAQLRNWDTHARTGLLWCNGLVPSFATSGHRNRIVHLHQMPESKLKWLVRPARRNSLATLAPSQFAASRIKGALSFPNWVDAISSDFSPKKISLPLNIGFLGRPSSIKGTHILIQAVLRMSSENPGSNILHIAGEPNFIQKMDAESIQELAAQLGNDIVWHGKVRNDAFFREVDVLVVPSIWDEVFGLVAAEAMSARVPLLVSDAGALPEVVGQDYPWIFERNNVDSLAQKILEVTSLLTNDAEKTEEIVNAAYWRWQENFSPEAGKARLQQLLSTLI